MKWLKNLGTVAMSMLVALLIGEAALRAGGMYADIAGSELEPSNTVWTRPLATIQTKKHPDLRHRITIVYDEMGIRNHSGRSVKEFKNAIGFFGDSFTENRRVEDEYSFTSLLNQFWGELRAINFGIDGFGIEQSYQRWLNYKDVVPMKDVVYVFCDNDLANLYEVQLFAVTASAGQVSVVNQAQETIHLSLKHRIYRLIGRLRTTYLVLEAYYRTRGRVLQTGALVSQYWDRFVNLRGFAVHQGEYRDRYADTMVEEVLSGRPSEDTRAWMRKFALVLDLWKRQVEAAGGRFHVAVLPTGDEKALLPLLVGDAIKDYRIIDLTYAESPAALKSYAPKFKADPHWNEIGNLAVVPGLVDYFSALDGKTYPASEEAAFVEEKISRIVAYYKGYDGVPNSSVER